MIALVIIALHWLLTSGDEYCNLNETPKALSNGLQKVKKD